MESQSVVKRFRGDYEFLSNFYPAKLMYDGIAYYHAEAAYQAQKCADPSQKMQFAKLYSDESKRFGRSIAVREDWEEIKLDVMKEVVRAKFEQNPRLAGMLLATGEMQLQEGNTWHDVFWGVDLKTGEGENHLGQILMQLREDFKINGVADQSKLRPVQEHYLGQNLVLTDEAMDDVITECTVKEIDDRNNCGLTPGAAMLNSEKGVHIIFVRSPAYMKDDESCLRNCYRNSLDIAAVNGIRSIAFPAISVGRKSFPKERASQIAVHTVMEWLADNVGTEMKVYLVPADPRTFAFMYEVSNKKAQQ